MDRIVQNFISYEATILLSKDGKKLIITVDKPIERIFDEESSSSCSEDDGDVDHDALAFEQNLDIIGGHGHEHAHEHGADVGGENLIEMKQVQSNASCDVSDIKGFVYGGFSSRFWLLRKHINFL